MQQFCTATVPYKANESPRVLDVHLLCHMHAEPTSSQGSFALNDVVVMPAFTASPNHHPSHIGPAAAAQHLALHIGDTTIQLPFSPAQAQQLDAELAKLLQTFSDKQAAKRPKR
jgi:hypothetical protein